MHATGVCSNQGGKLFKLHHVQVAHGLDQLDVLRQRVQLPGLLQHGAGAWVQGPHHGQRAGGGSQRFYDGGQALGVVGVLLAVDGGQHIVVFRQAQLGHQAGAGLYAAAVVQGHVIHHVAHLHDAACGIALALQVGGGCLRGGEQPARDAVGEDAVDLLGHGHVEAAQPGFDMRHGDVQLGGGQRAGQGGIGVAIDQHGIGALVLQHFFDLDQHAPGHGAVAAAVNVQKVVGLFHAQLGKEDVGHVGVKVLAGVHQHFLQASGLRHSERNHAGLDELWARAQDGDDFHDSR